MTQRVTMLEVESWSKHLAETGENLHVFIDGEDVTSRCYRAVFHLDHMHGDVWLYKKKNGHCYRDEQTGKVAEETRTGILRIEPGGPLR